MGVGIQGSAYESSDIIQFRRDLQQGDALCARLLTMCINPILWMLEATEAYRLFKQIGKAISRLLYIDDLKIFAASKEKLKRVRQIESGDEGYRS